MQSVLDNCAPVMLIAAVGLPMRNFFVQVTCCSVQLFPACMYYTAWHKAVRVAVSKRLEQSKWSPQAFTSCLSLHKLIIVVWEIVDVDLG